MTNKRAGSPTGGDLDSTCLAEFSYDPQTGKLKD
jgi:hypothetical protein